MKKILCTIALIFSVFLTFTVLVACDETIIVEPNVNKIENGIVYWYGEDNERITLDKEFIEFKGNTYYVINNRVVKGYYLIDDRMYDFGEDGIQKTEEINQTFVELNGNTYYVIHNRVVKGYYLIDDRMYNFGEDGIQKTEEINQIFVELNGNTYYVINNRVVKGYYLIDDRMYDFGEDGIQKTEEINQIFVELNGNTYYVIHNIIIKGYYLIDDRMYNFGEDGIQSLEEINQTFVEFSGNTYYVIHNMVVKGYYLLDDRMYDFGEDGVQKTEEINQTFVEFNGNIYYVIHNMIVKGYYLLDDRMYEFGKDGIQKTEEIDQTFVEFNGNTYYVIHNMVVKGYYLIDDRMYNFGEDGIQSLEEINQIFVELNGNTYYVIHNIIIKGYYLINDRMYDFGENGIQKTEEIDQTFVELNGNTYYVIHNMVVKGYYLLDDRMYNFGEDGIQSLEEINQTFVELNGNTYYIIHNMIVKGYYLINDRMYDFGENGIQSLEEIDQTFVGLNGNTYYIIHNMIVKGYYLIDDRMYDFGEDGVQKAEEIDQTFVELNGNTYYVIHNMVVKGYMLIDGSMYLFDTQTKIMYRNTNVDNYSFNEEGKIYNNNLNVNVYVVLGEETYFISGNKAYICCDYSGKVYVSDADENNENNELLTEAKITVTFEGFTFVFMTDQEGKYILQNIPCLAENFKIEKQGYITVNTVLSSIEQNNGLVVADKEVSNNLKGKIIIADSDMDYTNNRILSGATIVLERKSSTNKWSQTTTSDSSGNYLFTELTAGKYIMTVSYAGYITLSQTIYVHHNQQNVQNMALEMIETPEEGALGNASGTVVNASSGTGIEGLTIYVYEGVNTASGEVICMLSTTSGGQYDLSNVKPGNYTLKIVDERQLQDEKDRFGTGTLSVKVLQNKTISNQNTTVSNSSAINASSMRIVLTWGATPSDLDSHLTIVGNNTNAHIFYSNKSSMNATLDVDDTTSYGPETITITELNKNCVYTYYVYNYSQSGTFYNSGAMVRVYIGASTEPYYTFYAPAGTGYNWYVFTYDATTNTFTINDTIK